MLILKWALQHHIPGAINIPLDRGRGPAARPTPEHVPLQVGGAHCWQCGATVQIIAGTRVLIGMLLGLFVAPGFFALPALVGAGLMFTGVTGWCGMANLLRVMS
ncbi:rhodanese family protein [Sphingomonas sp. HF-S3]|uniref:Rhodanese family protein n=1 Tax=Sphingomonas rustica TaxID=3103142 RepID=A0ABV0B513_9SPHN